MPTSALFPFDVIRPGEILSQYAEWIYFTILLVFFVSVAGITLRRHFNKPYIRPLIVSVGLMLTVGVFMVRDRIVSVFEGWGMLGSFLLIVMAATVPYGLCRGFGLPARKAFYLTYILFYILSWVEFPGIYYEFADHNLGLVNLALLILCVYCAYKITGIGKSPRRMAEDLGTKNPFEPDIEHEIEVQDEEKDLIRHRGRKITAIELHTIDDIASELARIQQLMERNRNSISKDERQQITNLLRLISEKEGIFRRAAGKLKTTFERAGVMDEKQLQEMKQRLLRVSGRERHILKKEIEQEMEKLEIEKAVVDFQSKLDQYIYSFNQSLGSAVDKIRSSEYPYDGVPHITRARVILRDLSTMLEDMQSLQNRLIHITDIEKTLLKKERDI